MLKSLNEITQEDLEEITNLAAVYFTPAEIARIREIKTEDFVDACNTEGTAAFTAYNKGILQSEFKLRSGINMLAFAGSSPAQAMAMDMLKQSKIKRRET